MDAHTSRTIQTTQPAPNEYNSAQRLHAVWPSLAVSSELSRAVTKTAGPILLADDWVDTGWTLTVAAMRLREAGATAVLPLVLAAA